MATPEYDFEGGPLDGRRYPIRDPRGVLLVNKPAGQGAVYKVNGPVALFHRFVELDETELIDTGLGDRYDVLAYDPEEMRPWQ